MKNTSYSLLLSSLILNAPAATIQATAGNPAGGAGYTYHVALGIEDNTTFLGTVGSWSWEDQRLSLPDPDNAGSTLTAVDHFWRHQSDWVSVTLTEAALLSVVIERAEEGDNSLLFPAFSVYRGTNDTPDGAHLGPNNADVQWTADSTLLSFVGNMENSAAESAAKNFALPAGDYTILIGGNGVSEEAPVNVNYSATLNVTAIPEPSTSLLGLVATLGVFVRRRR